MERLGVIYKITCRNSNKFIYGSTINFNNRKSNYLSKLKNLDYSNQILQRLYLKYGWNSLVFEVVQDNISEDLLTFVEDIWIGANCSRIEDKKNGMNMRDASRPRFSDETRDKMSLSQKEKYENGYISPLKGKRKSQEQREKQSIYMKNHYKTHMVPKGSWFKINIEIDEKMYSISFSNSKKHIKV